MGKAQPAAEVLAYLLICHFSPISYNVVGSILHVHGKNTNSNCRLPVDGGGGTPRPVLLTCAKKSGVSD